MKQRIIIISLLIMCVMPSSAQWSLGITAGTAYNVLSMDKQYMTDYKIDGGWGFTVGLSGRYFFNNWLGMRADVNWTQKKYHQYRQELNHIDYHYKNDYLQLPVMMSFRFGGEKLHGICNLGMYGGYWFKSSREGSDYNYANGYTFEFDEPLNFNSSRDQRWDFGLAGGLGVEYSLPDEAAGFLIELLYYYSTVSITKQYMRVKDYRYNNTLAIQAGIFFLF